MMGLHGTLEIQSQRLTIVRDAISQTIGGSFAIIVGLLIFIVIGQTIKIKKIKIEDDFSIGFLLLGISLVIAGLYFFTTGVFTWNYFCKG